MAQFEVQDEDEIILVEFAQVPGVRTVSISPKDAIEKSQEAIEEALKKMRGMAKRTARAFKEIPITERPNTISISFGLKLTAEGGAVLAKAGVEAGVNVSMTWTQAPTTIPKPKPRGR